MSLDEDVVGSPGNLMSDCLTTGGGAHLYGGQCAEVSSFDSSPDRCAPRHKNKADAFTPAQRVTPIW
ncbi:hypothetical protein FH972_026489 [Carpinus fangiana]|uniref:Uncharacterized protein n=1 Tax=Carpinus fangiana TaxID=176857 RepID=A0A5N6L4G1_9ROSI|nr:hypothetical protein FH972_026489 [Carpinus fangiana]